MHGVSCIAFASALDVVSRVDTPNLCLSNNNEIVPILLRTRHLV